VSFLRDSLGLISGKAPGLEWGVAWHAVAFVYAHTAENLLL
jgi:hypothetical protein